MIIIKIILILFALILLWHFLTKKFLNPYKLIFVFGKKGSGKSTLLTKLAFQHLKGGRAVYSTEYLEFNYRKKVLSTIPFEPRMIYKYNFEPGSVVLIDEVSLIWDNRDFKSNFKDTRILEWFRYQRHHKVIVYMFSQTFDIDKKLRDLSDDMWLVTKIGRVLTMARHMIRKPVVVHPSEESPARIDDDIVIDGFLLAPFGGMKLAWIPYWAKKFDSFKKPDQGTPVPYSAKPHGESVVYHEASSGG